MASKKKPILRDGIKVKAGRPRKGKELNAKDLYKLGQIAATVAEAASFFEVSHDTFERRMKEVPPFKVAWDRGQEDGKASLRRKQMQMALAGDRTMLIWLGKNRLGQKDNAKVEHTGANGGPIQAIDLSQYSAEELALLEPMLRRMSDKVISGEAEAQLK